MVHTIVRYRLIMDCQPATTSTSIADAAIRVVARQGLDRLSVRNVARQAGVAPGTVQHHYRTRAQLLDAALARVVERQVRRVDEGGGDDSGIRALRFGLRALLPVDEPRREEAIVWIAFAAAAAATPSLARRHRAVVELTRQRIGYVIELGQEQGEVPASIDPARAAVEIAAFVDGLLVHAIGGDDSAESIEAHCDDAVTRLLGLHG
jgi:AcrR family transcriptional regulator